MVALSRDHDQPVASGPDAIEAADVAAAVAAGRARSAPVVRVLGAVSEIADQVPSMLSCGALLAVGLASGKPKLAGAGGRMLASVLVAALLKSAAKTLVSRTRPHAVLEGEGYEFEVRGKQGPHDHSFPSGHTAGAVAAARAFARVYPGGSAAAYAAATAVALIQLPRGKHYPADLAGGALVGIAAEIIVQAGAARLERWERDRGGPRPAGRSLWPTA